MQINNYPPPLQNLRSIQWMEKTRCPDHSVTTAKVLTDSSIDPYTNLSMDQFIVISSELLYWALPILSELIPTDLPILFLFLSGNFIRL